MSAVLFWLAVLALLYAYVGFPLLVAAVGRLAGRPVQKEPVTPRLTLIIAAYNEEAVIGERLENALACDYPPEALEIIVASDGSTDATAAIVTRYADRGVRLLALPRQGKNVALAAAVEQARGEILVFSDANIMCERQALRALAANFADPRVGGVSGYASYRVERGSESSSRGEKLYLRYDSWLKELESASGSIVAAHGALYAIRRELYEAPVDPSTGDDFAISTAVIARGRRLVFERGARAYELAVPEARREFQRHVRTTIMSLHGVALRRALLNPLRSGFYAVVLFSHKVLRRLVPVFLLVLLAGSLALAGRGGFYALALAAQLLFYAVAALGWLARGKQPGHLKALYIPFYYCMGNGAALLGLVQAVRGQRTNLWQPQRHALRGAP